MIDNGFLLQFAGSLIAIVALAGLVVALKLGGAPSLDSDEEARAVARSLERGFVPCAVARDADGKAALLRDATGRILLVRRHGGHFVSRILTARAHAQLQGDALYVETAERRFGGTALRLPDPESWLHAITGAGG